MTRLAEASDVFVTNNFDVSNVNSALDWATSVIEGYTGRTFDLVIGEVSLVDPRRGAALLPHFPVVRVSDVSAWMPDPNGSGMAWVSLTNYAFVPETGLLYDTSGLPGSGGVVHGPTWPWLPASLRVIYDHGFERIPRALRDVCARLAQQYLENPTLAMQSRVGEVESRYSGSSGLAFSAHDRAILDRFCDVGVS